MSKRSDFERRAMDDYPTIDPRAARMLVPFLPAGVKFAEPCAGKGILVGQLEMNGFVCAYRSDLQFEGIDALAIQDFGDAELIITNPPWTREILHPMIRHFQSILPTWLLFDADWMHTGQAAEYLDQCSDVVTVGRLKWIEGSKHQGKDNCAWFRFWHEHTGGPRFHKMDAAARNRPEVYA